MDYSENYVNRNRHQIQSAYFGQQSFLIFFACCYLNIEVLLVNENATIISEASSHSRIAALSYWLRILSVIQEKYPSLQKSLVLHIWSDGCAGQFCSRFVFSLLTQFAVNHKLFWYYNERHHGKAHWMESVEPSNTACFGKSSLAKLLYVMLSILLNTLIRFEMA